MCATMSTRISRRGILGSLGAGAGLAACGAPSQQNFSSNGEQRAGRFAHGIASGDPTTNAVILWTRITPADPTGGAMEVVWEVDRDADFKSLSASGKAVTSAARDWTVKVDANQLNPGKTYYYRFRIGDDISAIGKTKTLPKESLSSARFAVVSCANWQHGYFNTYDHISRHDHFDALLHLGDYYYEYPADTSEDSFSVTQGRLHEPRHEIITLDDYRQRHAQYRSDSSLQAATAKMPMISIWDDHETSNDSWRTGAENHQDGEGEWETRKRAALRAYYEWMPIREPKAGRAREAIFRHYNYGDLLSLITVETRLLARDEPLIIDDYFDMIREDKGTTRFNEVLNQDREMLGELQTDFIVETLKTSKENGQTWRMLANQVVIGRVTSPDLTPHVNEDALVSMEKAWSGVRDFVEFSQYSLPTYTDSWDGYPVARNKFYDRLNEAGINDILVVTGDSHEFWVNDLTNKNGEAMGVELGTTSVSSHTLSTYMGSAAEDYALLMTQNNPDVRYYNPMLSGYLDLELSQTKGTARLISMNTVASRDYTATETASFTLRPTAKGSLKVSSPKGLNLQQRALFSGLG